MGDFALLIFKVVTDEKDFWFFFFFFLMFIQLGLFFNFFTDALYVELTFRHTPFSFLNFLVIVLKLLIHLLNV